MSHATKKSCSTISLVMLILLVASSSHSIAQEKSDANINGVPLIYQKLNGDLKRDNRILKAQVAEFESRYKNTNKSYLKSERQNFELGEKLRKSMELQENSEQLAERSELEIEMLKNQMAAVLKKVNDGYDKAYQELRAMADDRSKLMSELIQRNKKLKSESQKLVGEADFMLKRFLSDKETDEIRSFTGNAYLRQIAQYSELIQAGNKKENIESLIQVTNKLGEESELGAVAKKIVKKLISEDPFTENPFD